MFRTCLKNFSHVQGVEASYQRSSIAESGSRGKVASMRRGALVCETP
jgi:hypothetical protein